MKSEYVENPMVIDNLMFQHANVPAKSVDKTLDEMLSVGANVNIYMFHGGNQVGYAQNDIFLIGYFVPQFVFFFYIHIRTHKLLR